MDTEIKQKVISVLTSLKEILSSDQIIPTKLKQLSDELVDGASLCHDQDCISISVLAYSLYKIFLKNLNIEKTSLLEYVKIVLDSVDNDIHFRSNVRKLFDHLKKYDKNIDINILQIIKHVQVKSGLKMYDHGLSIGQAAEIMGVSKWNIMEYLGASSIVDQDSSYRIDCKTRLNFTKGLFK